MWTFILTDTSGRHVGEILNAYDRTVALPLNKLDTMSFRVRIDNPLSDVLVATAGNIKAYRNNSLLYHGPIISAEETGDANGASVAINSVGAGWIFTKRLAGKSNTGRVFSSLRDRAKLIDDLIDDANNENETGINYDSSNSSASAITYTAGPYRPISEIITELSASYDGFDWRILPRENWYNGAVSDSKVGTFHAEPAIGTDRGDAVFEWGDGRQNIVGYTRTVSRDTQANKVYHYTSNGPDAPGYPTVSAIDASSISDWRLLEDLAQADLLDQGLRQQLVNEHVKIRKHPRQVIQFEPHIDPGQTGRLPSYGTDYSVGDRVRARAVYAGRVRFDGMFRVWGVTFTLDNNGLEKAALTLTDEGS